MTIIREGEKFACKQCIQGHRVSTCHHEERPLIHVARKGRPVSQCVHCRGLRKARQTHIKCDCGERRHSRKTSSESATICGSDDNACQCASGKKCTCALKKETRSGSESHLTMPFADRSPKLPSFTRRSESAVPRTRKAYQPAMQRTFGSADYSAQYQMPQSPLSRGHHGYQRSADSLPMPSVGQSFVPSMPTSSTHLLAPSLMAARRNDHFLSVHDDMQNFNIPLDQNVLARTLSPQNPKRYSMNDWSMMTFNVNDMAQFGQGAYSFPPTESRPMWQDGWDLSAANTPPLHATAHFDDGSSHGQPKLSMSSTETISDFGEGLWNSERAQSFPLSQPTITLDPSSCQPAYDDKNALSWTPASYQDMQSEYSFPGSSLTPTYSHGQSGDNYSETSGFVDPNEYSYHGSQTHGSPLAEVHYGLADRSVPPRTESGDSDLNAAFKFPAHDPYFAQTLSDQPIQKEWLADDGQPYLDFLDAASPISTTH